MFRVSIIFFFFLHIVIFEFDIQDNRKLACTIDETKPQVKSVCEQVPKSLFQSPPPHLCTSGVSFQAKHRTQRPVV